MAARGGGGGNVVPVRESAPRGADDLDSKIKVVVIGPKKIGKSVVCDFLTG